MAQLDTDVADAVSLIPPLEPPRHVGDLLEWVRTCTAILAVCLQVAVLVILLSR
jgi:hypothetical protein